jgi:hypothetical protein
MTPIAQLPTLEARWLEYIRRTQPVFDAHPQMISLRQMTFKSFVQKHETLSLTDRAKQFARLALRQGGSEGELSPVDIVFWLDSPREVLVEAILPVLKQVRAAGVRAALITTQAVYEKIKIDPSIKPILFQVPYRWGASEPWKRGWTGLRAVLPQDLQDDSLAAFCDLGNHADNTVAEVTRLLTALKPRLMILPVDQLLPGSAACTAANNLGIETLVLLHGAVSAYNAPVTARQMSVWGAMARDQMMKYGVPEKQLIALGSPRHDTFPAPLPADVRARFQTALGLPDKPTLVFFSNGNDLQFTSREAAEGCAAWLNTAAEQLSDRVQFVVRLHPNEDDNLYTNYPLLRVFKNEADLATTIGAADVCGTLCSTVMLDALLYRKPILQFYADGWPHLADNWGRGLAQRIENPTQLIEFLTAGIEDHQVWQQLANAQSGLTETVFANHRRAAETVAQYAIEQVTPTPHAARQNGRLHSVR